MTLTEHDVQAALRKALQEDREQRASEQRRANAVFEASLAAACICAALTLAAVGGLMYAAGYLWPATFSFLWGGLFGLSFWGYVLACGVPAAVFSVVISFLPLVAGGQTGTNPQ